MATKPRYPPYIRSVPTVKTQEFVKRLAKKPVFLTIHQAQQSYAAVLETLQEILHEGKGVLIPLLGKMVAFTEPDGMKTDPRNGSRSWMKGKKRVRFYASATFKARLNAEPTQKSKPQKKG